MQLMLSTLHVHLMNKHFRKGIFSVYLWFAIECDSRVLNLKHCRDIKSNVRRGFIISLCTGNKMCFHVATSIVFLRFMAKIIALLETSQSSRKPLTWYYYYHNITLHHIVGFFSSKNPPFFTFFIKLKIFFLHI